MYVDEDKNGTNYPLAAFVFDEDDMVPPVSPAYLCRFDASRLECFTTPLFTRGERSHIPFVGVIVKNTYLYGNGLGIQDVDPMTSVAATRPLFLVRNINENEPVFESTEYYINRVDNSRMRCADLTSFDQDACFLDDGTQVDCVSPHWSPRQDSIP